MNATLAHPQRKSLNKVLDLCFSLLLAEQVRQEEGDCSPLQSSTRQCVALSALCDGVAYPAG